MFMDIPGIPSIFLYITKLLFFIHIQIPTTPTPFTPSTLLPPSSHNRGPTHLSILDIFHTISIPHRYLHRITVLQLSVFLCTFILLKLSSTATDSPSMGVALRVTMHWWALISIPGCRDFLQCLLGGSSYYLCFYSDRPPSLSSSFACNSTFSVCSQ